MKIVVDENMPLTEALFSEFGEIIRCPGRTLTAEQLADADVLLVRSVTKVNPELLSKAEKLQFVGTATIGPRKARRMVDLIRGKKATEAITILKFAPQDASLPVRKVLESAIANARVKADKAGEPFRENDLVVKETYVDEGVTLKRFRARAQGRAARINKRTSHITVVVANKEGNR